MFVGETDMLDEGVARFVVCVWWLAFVWFAYCESSEDEEESPVGGMEGILWSWYTFVSVAPRRARCVSLRGRGEREREETESHLLVMRIEERYEMTES
jgi:hypothetical protein